MAKSRADESLILKIAMLYYDAGMTQDEIAKKYNKSRPTIVRILQQARDSGLVEIRITKPLPETAQYESEIEAAFGEFGLREVIVVETGGGEPKAAVARAAAAHLVAILKPTDILGISYSSTLLGLPDAMEEPRRSPKRVVQLGGGVSFPDSGHAQETVFRLGRILSAPVESVNAPVLVKNSSVRKGLLGDPNIQSAIRWADKCSVAIMGVGTADAKSTLVKVGYLNPEDVQGISSKGAVGDILSRYFDENGNEIAAPWNDRLITRTFSQLAAIDNVIVAAAGAGKARSMLGALRLGFVKTVILDASLAKALVKILRVSAKETKKTVSA